MSAGDTFTRDGYLGPVSVLDADECRSVASYLRRRDLPEPPAWDKGRAVTEPLLYELATRLAILEPVAEVLGDDIVLWGVSVASREPGRIHPWHSDIESSAAGGGFVSVWIGIEGTTRHSSLQLIPGSHRYDESVQEARARRDVGRAESTAETTLALARGRDAKAELLVPGMSNGQAIFFDGRLWHGTDNRSSDVRHALLVQFAAADRAVGIPDWTELDWPFRFRADVRPPVILVRGTGRGSTKQIAKPRVET
jgi:hypothetical protein